MGRRTDITTSLIKSTFNQRFLMARLTKVPFFGKLVIYAFFDKDDMIYLPKDDVALGSLDKSRTIAMNVVANPHNMVLPSRVVEHFINESRYIFLMDRCICRNANECQDYPEELGCIFLGRGVVRIPKNMGRIVTKDEALEHLKRAREAGLVHLIGRNKIDSIWLDTGPKEDLLSICNCCPCCCLWKMIPYMSSEVRDGINRMPGVEVRVNPDACKGCGACIEDHTCFVKALSVLDGKSRIDQSLCKGCGRCVTVCRHKAIELRIVDSAFLEKSIKRIDPLVDVRIE